MDFLLCHEWLISPESSSSDALMFVEASSWHNNVLTAESRNFKPVLAQINAKLNDSKTRPEGLLLLNCVLRQVSPQAFAENCQHWALHLKNLALHDPDVRLRCLSMNIFGEILNLAAKHPEQNRQFASALVPQFVPHLLNLDEKNDLVVAHGLRSVLRFLPGSCRQHSTAIQKRLVEMLSTKNPELVEVSSTCMAMLPFLSGGERGKTQTMAWSELYGKLCNSLQSELDVLYENLEVDQRAGKDSDNQILFPATLESADPAAVFLDVYHRTVGICACLQKMLSVGSSASMTVPVEVTVGIVGRMLKVTGKAVASRSTVDKHMVLLFAFLPALHKEALVILENLILSSRRHLLLHDQKILSLFLQTLQWTSLVQQGNSENRQALSKLRGLVYRVFATWLNVAGAGSDLSHLGDAITRHMLADIRCEEKTAKLADSSNAKATIKRGKRRKYEEPLMAVQASPNFLVDGETCRMALKGLKAVVYNAVEDLKTRTFKDLCSKVISVLLALQPGTSDPAAVVPYGDVGCRAALYELLLSVLAAPCAVSHSLLSEGIHIFSRGQMDHSPKVTEICCQALATCRTIIEPVRRYLPQGPPGQARADICEDNRPETPLSDVDMEVDMEVTHESDIPEAAHEKPSPLKIARSNGHLPSASAEPVAGSDLELWDGSSSNPQESVENGLIEKLSCVDLDSSDEEEKAKDNPDKDEDKEEMEENPTLVTVNPQAVENRPGPVPSPEPNLARESLDSRDPSNAEREELLGREHDEVEVAADVAGVGKPSTVDAILRSFVDSFPDDEGRGKAEVDESSE